MNTITTFSVTGMTSGHCASSVRTAVSAIDGVTAVDVDLPSGAVIVTSDGPVDRDAVGAAVVDAGYQLAS